MTRFLENNRDRLQPASAVSCIYQIIMDIRIKAVSLIQIADILLSVSKYADGRCVRRRPVRILLSDLIFSY